MITIPFPYGDPLAAFEVFASDPHAVLLHGNGMGENGRYTYLAAAPFRVIHATHKGVTIDGEAVAGDPFSVLERELQRYREDKAKIRLPFSGGAIGFFGYELGGVLERLPVPRRDGLELPLLSVGLYDTIVLFDHEKREAWVASTGRPETSVPLQAARAASRAQDFLRRLAAAPARNNLSFDYARGSWRPELSRAEAERRIAKIIDYIHAGDIFQANFTQRFFASRPEGMSDYMLFRRLCAQGGAPFAAFLRCGEGVSIAGASPERFLRLSRDGAVEACPIKGTRPRDADPVRDRSMADQLNDSIKDRAENLMIVDLMRSDLGRVCELGSVKVPRLCTLESFATVHHLTSVITGKLKPGAGAVDLLRATFPGGSITGAPKIRAMEIIHELEPAPRGVYCGCLGWIGFDGAMDMSMTIRTLTISGDTILAQAGGGIVADSDPAAEYDECMVKIAPLLRAVSGDAA